MLHSSNQSLLLHAHRKVSRYQRVQVSFEDTVKFHNDLISEKLEYITKELPDIEQQIRKVKSEISILRKEEDLLTETLNKSALVEDFEKTILELNKQFERKGNLEEQKRLWIQSIENLANIEKNLPEIKSQKQML